MRTKSACESARELGPRPSQQLGAGYKGGWSLGGVWKALHTSTIVYSSHWPSITPLRKFKLAPYPLSDPSEVGERVSPFNHFNPFRLMALQALSDTTSGSTKPQPTPALSPARPSSKAQQLADLEGHIARLELQVRDRGEAETGSSAKHRKPYILAVLGAEQVSRLRGVTES